MKWPRNLLGLSSTISRVEMSVTLSPMHPLSLLAFFLRYRDSALLCTPSKLGWPEKERPANLGAKVGSDGCCKDVADSQYLAMVSLSS